MSPDSKMAEVVVIGAGTAGAAVALLCAERGMEVLCLERNALDSAGAHWVNDVDPRAFDEAGIARPGDGECLHQLHAMTVVAGFGPHRVVAHGLELCEVDMTALVARLQSLGRAAGARFMSNVEVRGLEADRLDTSEGTIRAPFVVDASGLNGVRLLDLPRVPRNHLCVAAQGVYELANLGAAESFFVEHGGELGETLCFTGFEGGYSILRAGITAGGLHLLTGSIPARGYRSGKQILDDFVAEHPWIGPRLKGGARAIPIRRPYDLLARGDVASIGDAACQVFPAHGSGIGAGLIAARMLADALAEGKGPEGYGVRWQRAHGGRFAAYDVFRRVSEDFSLEQLETLIESEIMDPASVSFGLEQSLPSLSPKEMLKKARNAVRAMPLALTLGAMSAKMAAVLALYKAYPSDPARLERWSGLVSLLFGDPRDIRRGN